MLSALLLAAVLATASAQTAMKDLPPQGSFSIEKMEVTTVDQGETSSVSGNGIFHYDTTKDTSSDFHLKSSDAPQYTIHSVSVAFAENKTSYDYSEIPSVYSDCECDLDSDPFDIPPLATICAPGASIPGFQCKSAGEDPVHKGQQFDIVIKNDDSSTIGSITFDLSGQYALPLYAKVNTIENLDKTAIEVTFGKSSASPPPASVFQINVKCAAATCEPGSRIERSAPVLARATRAIKAIRSLLSRRA